MPWKEIVLFVFMIFFGAYRRALALLMLKMFKDKCKFLFNVRNEDMIFHSEFVFENE